MVLDVTDKGRVSPRVLVDNFRELHPEMDSVTKIVEFGNETQFVRKYGATLPGRDREARQVYRSAKNLQMQANLLWMNIKEAASPYFGRSLFNNLAKDLPQRFIEQQETIPGYDRLFNSLDFIECDHYRSIFGPAAYFVDLMRFVEQNITGQVSASGSLLTLEERRPDLARIRLDADNTSDLIPCIDLVNELLEEFIKTVETADEDAYEVVKNEFFPMSLPLHLPLAEIRSYLQQFKLSLHQIYETFHTDDGTHDSELKRQVLQSFLSLSTEEFSLIVSELVDKESLSKHYGGEFELTGEEGLENVDVLLAQTNLTQSQLNELLFQDLDQHEVNAGLSRLFFINNVSDGLGYLEIEPATASDSNYDRLFNLSWVKLDRIHRFLRLARKLGWSFTELDQVLRSLQPAYEPEAALRFDGINDHAICQSAEGMNESLDTFTLEAWIHPERAGEQVIVSKGSITERTVHFMLLIDEDNKLVFYGERIAEATSGRRFKVEMKSVYTIPLNVFTHVAVVVGDQTVRFYINGRADQGIALSGTSIAATGADLTIGRALVGGSFAGILKDIRIWQGVRELSQIVYGRYRLLDVTADAGAEDSKLLAYWPLVETIDGKLRDHTGNGYDAVLGSESLVSEPRWVSRDLVLDPLPQMQAASSTTDGDYRPKPTEAKLPEFSNPLAPQRTVLQLDGDNDVVVVKNEKNWGLGRFDRWTLAFWFKPTNSTLRERRQLLFTQGDEEAGISIFLYQDRLHVVQWCNPLNQNSPQSSVLVSEAEITYGEWQHITVVHNEFPSESTADGLLPVEDIQVSGLLDGGALKAAESDNDEVVPGFRLSPVGVICLGGLAQGQTTQFSEQVASDSETSYFFAGEMSDFRLWRTVKPAEEIESDRTQAPIITPDLIAYLPLDEAEGWLLKDYAGTQHQNPFRGTLQRREIILQTTYQDTSLQSLYTHYVIAHITEEAQPQDLAGKDSLAWKDYFYAGRLRLDDRNDAIGLTFLSRRPESKDQYYQLSRNEGEPFSLSAYPSGVQTIKSADPDSDRRVTNIQPEPGTWYKFLIRVQDLEDRTKLQAKIWIEGEAEPAEFQIDAYDDNPDIRITAGTVGLWAEGSSTGTRQFDSLKVWPLSIANPTPTDLLLDINFEAPSHLPDPEMWEDSGDRTVPLNSNESLFKSLETPDGRSVFGTESTLNNIHAHYSTADADGLNWKDYTFEGQLQVTDADSSIGVTFLNRYPSASNASELDTATLKNQYYSLQRDAQQPTFHLVAHPEGVQPVSPLSAQAKLDSGIEPQINVWYRFSIEVLDNLKENRTEIRAKVWESTALEPNSYQIVAYDDTSIRIRSGSVGIWASGSGAKYFDRLTVAQNVRLSERFEGNGVGQNPQNWLDTKAQNSQDKDDSLFETAEVETNTGKTVAFGSRSGLTNIHSHYSAPEALEWKNYIYSGRLFISDEDSGIGVTFLSHYTDPTVDPGEHDRYYRLRRYRDGEDRAFHLASHPDETASLMQGKINSGVVPEPNTWYRFRIEVEDSGAQTNIQASVWKEGTLEPDEFQINAFDESDSRLTAGTVGLWTADGGRSSDKKNKKQRNNQGKYFDDLSVSDGLLLSSAIASEHWTEMASRDRYWRSEDLFTAIDVQDNPLKLITSNTLPLRNAPLSETALLFNGQHHYLTGTLEAPKPLGDFTLEAWVNPTLNELNPIISLIGTSEAASDRSDSSNTKQIDFGLTAENKLKLSIMDNPVEGSRVLDAADFVHVAVRVRGNAIAFWMAGEKLGEELTLESTAFSLTAIEVGRSRNASAFFSGQIKEIRLWNKALADQQILTGLQQQPDLRSVSLLGYWQLGEALTVDEQIAPAKYVVPNRAITGQTTLQPGVAPALVSPIGIELPESGFWRSPRRILALDGTQSVQFVAPEETAADRQQQTVEVWFQVADKTLSKRKQIVYHEGDTQRGLVLYVYDSELYFVGYNTPAEESRWAIEHGENWWIDPSSLRQVWRMKSDRIESNRWHHAALVLDGRDEVRPESLRCYLNGKLVAIGPGSKLWQHRRSFSLGAANSDVVLHDGLQATKGEAALQGGILQLRLWSSARSTQQIQEYWTQDLPSDPSDVPSDLALVWNFAEVEANNIPDSSGHNQNGVLNPGSQMQTLRQSLQGIAAYSLDPVTLDESALRQIADIKRLKDSHKLPVDRLTALWSDIKHVGRANAMPLFDKVFNPEGVRTDRWNYYIDRPIRWDRIGRENPNRDRQTRARLMDALRVSSQVLDIWVSYLSHDERIVELDTAYLCQLYRLSQLPKLLNISTVETMLLLVQMNHPSVDNLSDILLLTNQIDWLNRNSLSVAELIFFGQSVESNHSKIYSVNKLRDFIKALNSQIRNLLINGESFVTVEITQAQSLSIFEYLKQQDVLSLINTRELKSLSPVQQQLQAITAVVPGASINAISHTDALLNLDGLIDHLAETENWSDIQRENLSASITEAVQARLMQSRSDLSETILNGLATLFDSSADLVDVVAEYFNDQAGALDAIAFVRPVYGLNTATVPIPLNLSIYLAKLGKLLSLLVKFELTVKEAKAFLSKPAILFSPADGASEVVLDDLLQPALHNIEQLSYFKALKAAFNDEVGQLVDLLETLEDVDLRSVAANDSAITSLTAFTAWEPREIVTLVKALDLGNRSQIEVLNRLQQGFAIAQQMGSDIDFLLQLSSLDKLDFAFYREQANILKQVLQANYNDDTWAKIYKPIKHQLALQKRDALLALAMKKLPDSLKSRKDPDILYEYFLMDMQVGGEVEISRIVQATASLQLYVQRCLMNLEADIDPAKISQEEWEWVKNYRVWEANRKVFLYPENYIEPELRPTKTPLFAELEQELLQSDITQEAVERVYVSYLDKFTEVAKLKVVGSYLHRDLEGDPNPGDETLYLVGRTDTQPRLYYIRRHIKNKTGARWLPWEKIDLAINADFATPVYAFGKLFIFWTEFTPLKRSESRRLSENLRRISVSVLRELIVDIRGIALSDSKADLDNDNLLLNGVTSGDNKKQSILTGEKTLKDRKLKALKLLRVELTREELAQLYKEEWTIDREHYLFDSRIVGRVQELVDFYQVSVKFSYYNFGKHWIPAQVNSQTTLTAEQYQQAKWHSLYAQRAYSFVPKPDDRTPRLAPNRRVLQVNRDTQLALPIPRIKMEKLTWSFWARFSRSGAQRYKGSVANNPEAPLKDRRTITVTDLQQTLVLLNYDSEQFRVTVTNSAISIPGAQQKENAVRRAVQLTTDAAAQQNLNQAQTQLDEIKTIATDAIPAIETAKTKVQEAIAAQTAAVEARRLANEASGNERAEREANATAKERERDRAKQAADKALEEAKDAAKAQLLLEVETFKWKISDLSLKIQLGNGVPHTSVRLAVDTWQHIAITLDETVQNQVRGYRVSCMLHQEDDTPAIESSQFIPANRLNQRGLLEVANPIAVSQQNNQNRFEGEFAERLKSRNIPSEIFTTRISELQVVDTVKPTSAIKAERLQRKKSSTGVFSLPLNEELRAARMDFVALQERELRLVEPIFESQLPGRLQEDRERILIFYGDKIRSIRNNLQEQGFDLTLDRSNKTENYDVKLKSYQAPGRSAQSVLSLATTPGLFLNDFATSGDDIIQDSQLPSTDDTNSFLISQLQKNDVAFFDVHNRPGWYVIDTGDDQFLVKAIFKDAQGETMSVPTAAELMNIRFDSNSNSSQDQLSTVAVSIDSDPSIAPAKNAVSAVTFEFERLNTYAVYQLSQNLFTGGIDKFLSVESQQSKEFDFEKGYRPTSKIQNKDKISKRIDFQGNYRLYYEEVFFHIPFLIANQLNKNQQFAEAQKWYHYIFNPTAAEGSGQDRYWRYLPFRNRDAMSLQDALTQEEALAVYREDPANPHAIASLRLTTYQKAVVMKYIDNLLDWGDSLFSQDTRESINEATMLYVLAFNLLGPKPIGKAYRTLDEIGTYNDFSAAHESESEFLSDVEKRPHDQDVISLSPHDRLLTHFCVPENEKFIGYWDRVADRLYKIRHSLNIEGVFRQLALFDSPIDPADLVSAAASGLGIGGSLANLNVSVPHYRYSSVLEQAKEVTSMVVDFGSTLLSAIEAKEDSQLSGMQRTYERTILNMVTRIKEYDQQEVEAEIEALTISRENVNARYEYYKGLVDGGTAGLSLNAAEGSAITANTLAGVANIAGGIIDVAAEFTESVPTFSTGANGFGGSPEVTVKLTGENLSAPFRGARAISDLAAEVLSFAGQLSEEIGEYQRRKEEWEQEKKVAEIDLREIDQQIVIANLRLQRTERERQLHNKEIQHSQDIADFHRNKFANSDLRIWITGRLSSLYFQAYKLAYDLAKGAEKSLQYELPTTQTFISPSHWDSLKKGLLAGESLLLELNQMDKVRLDQDSRFQEIQKNISLKRTFPEVLESLKQDGVCDFSLGEKLFNQDFPGHYCRLIKTIALSVKTNGDIDPYNSVHATLSQTGSKTLLVPDDSAVDYLLDPTSGDQPDASTLRVNWRANQQIAISKPDEDNGMFSLNFYFDDRYFPFEGTGTVSSWRLEMPKETNPSLVKDNRLEITDVVLHIRYTSKSDQGVFKRAVQEKMNS